MVHGWTGTSLRCRLDDGAVELFDRPAARRAFLGGRGYGVALLAEFGSPQLPPLDPAQPFVFAAGPLTGTTAPSSGRFAAVAPSPLTGTIFDGNAGGRFGVRLRQAGLDALVLVGQAPTWVMVVVDGREETVGSGSTPQVRLLPLRDLWPAADPADPTLVSTSTVAGLRRALGPAFSVVFPSVAGRRGALLGCLRTDDRRTLGRGGLGAALAAKRVFAVAVAGDRSLQPADPDRFAFLVYEAEKQVSANPVTSRALPEFGTAVLMNLVAQAGALPALNYRTTAWSGGPGLAVPLSPAAPPGAGSTAPGPAARNSAAWPEVEAITGEALRDGLVVGRRGCFGCRIRCTPRVTSGGRDFAGRAERARAAGGRGLSPRGTQDYTEGPEYETLWALGADCGVADLGVIQEANRLCGEYGLDTISTGATIACAMELAEAGALARTLRFGDAERLLELVRQMGEGTGFGAELADGSARFAACYGHPEVAMHVKGLELPAYDPRGMQGQGLAYATSNRGACHLRGNMLGPEILGIPKLVDRFATRGKSGILLNLQHLSAVFDSACLCKFAGFAFGEEVLARLLGAVTGEPLAASDLLRVGERIWNAERLWNVAAGFTRADDTLPARLLAEPLPAGPAAGRVVDLEPMLDEYYRARGWDVQGVPRPDKWAALGLDELAGGLVRMAAERAHARAESASASGAEPDCVRAGGAERDRAPAGGAEPDHGPGGKASAGGVPAAAVGPALEGEEARHLRAVP